MIGRSTKEKLKKEIENKIAETVKGYHKRISDKKLVKQIHKAGKILSKSLAKEHITIAHKEKAKAPKKEKKEAEKEVAS